jgi:hypothetical protein
LAVAAVESADELVSVSATAVSWLLLGRPFVLSHDARAKAQADRARP